MKSPPNQTRTNNQSPKHSAMRPSSDRAQGNNTSAVNTRAHTGPTSTTGAVTKRNKTGPISESQESKEDVLKIQNEDQPSQLKIDYEQLRDAQLKLRKEGQLGITRLNVSSKSNSRQSSHRSAISSNNRWGQPTSPPYLLPNGRQKFIGQFSEQS